MLVVEGLEFLVDGFEFFVGALEFLVRGLEFLDGGLEAHFTGAEVLFEIGDAEHAFLEVEGRAFERQAFFHFFQKDQKKNPVLAG